MWTDPLSLVSVKWESNNEHLPHGTTVIGAMPRGEKKKAWKSFLAFANSASNVTGEVKIGKKMFKIVRLSQWV